MNNKDDRQDNKIITLLKLLKGYSDFNGRRNIKNQLNEIGLDVKDFEKWFVRELETTGLYVPDCLKNRD